MLGGGGKHEGVRTRRLMCLTEKKKTKQNLYKEKNEEENNRCGGITSVLTIL